MLKAFRRLLFVMLFLSPVSTMADENMTKEEIEIRSSLKEGMSRGEVESFFEERGIDYVFSTREEDKRYAPQFPWKAEDAIGYYGTVIRDVGTWFLWMGSEHLVIGIEIDSQGKVSQVNIQKAYDAP